MSRGTAPPTRSGGLEIKSSGIDFYEDEILVIVSIFVSLLNFLGIHKLLKPPQIAGFAGLPRNANLEALEDPHNTGNNTNITVPTEEV